MFRLRPPKMVQPSPVAHRPVIASPLGVSAWNLEFTATPLRPLEHCDQRWPAMA